MTIVDYERPPVVETVLGIQFDALSTLNSGHLGAFWKTLSTEWSAAGDAPALEPQMENFADSPNWGVMAIQFKLSRDVTNRLQIRNADGDRMIQVQNGRLHLNWLGHGGAEYPRYRQMRSEFEQILRHWQSFVRDEGIGELKMNQWEVTYINRIEQSTVWFNPADWSFFRPLAPEVHLSTVTLESFGGEWHYEIPPQRGRLHVQFQHVRQNEAATPEAVVLRLQLAVRSHSVDR